VATVTFVYVCLYACPRSKRKTAQAINAKLGMHTFSMAVAQNAEVEKSKVKVTRL